MAHPRRLHRLGRWQGTRSSTDREDHSVGIERVEIFARGSGGLDDDALRAIQAAFARDNLDTSRLERCRKTVELRSVGGHYQIFKTGQGAHAFRSAGDKRHVYVSNRVANTVSLLNYQTLQVVRQYKAPGGPDCMEVSADGKWLMVSSRWIRKMSVIDLETGKLVRQVRVGKSPHGIWTLAHAKRQ